jgi:hypothetical protein
MVKRIVTADETWVLQYQTESKRASMQCNHPTSSSTKSFKVTSTPSAGKIMFTVFWDSQGVLLAHCQKRGENVNSVSYCEVLLKIWDEIRKTTSTPNFKRGTASS